MSPSAAAADPGHGARLAPGATIGILGDGQLGRMTALAAARLGYRTHIYGTDADAPAAQVASAVTVARFDDQEALARFAAAVDVVTLEWENLPVASLEFLAPRVPVRPGAAVLAVTQDRTAEKAFANRLGIATAPWRAATTAAEVAAAVAELGRPAVLKSTRLGYDGKGQALLTDGVDAVAAWQALGAPPAIVEGFVAFERELSVIAARGLDGRIALYPAVENRHCHHILAETLVPAPVTPAVAAQAEAIARTVAEGLAVVGLIAVELFVTADGTVLLNELAPRPHNSGHWTLDAAATSQFEQLVRAVCGLPLGPTEALMPARMLNLVGAQVDRWPDYLADPQARLHLYGKRETRPGRKMGHVTWLLPER